MQRLPKTKKIWTVEDVFPGARLKTYSKTRDLERKEDIQEIKIKIKKKKTKKASTDWLGRRRGKISTNRKKIATGTHTVPGVKKARTKRKKNVYIRSVF